MLTAGPQFPPGHRHHRRVPRGARGGGRGRAHLLRLLGRARAAAALVPRRDAAARHGAARRHAHSAGRARRRAELERGGGGRDGGGRDCGVPLRGAPPALLRNRVQHLQHRRAV